MADPIFEKLLRPDPIIRADAVQSVAFERRDVGKMAQFLLDFGLLACDHPGNTRYFRGHGDSPFLASVTPADGDAFRGFAFSAADRQDLEILARATGTRVESSDDLGGGLRVRLTDPDGLRVDLTHGFERVKPIATRDTPLPFNTPDRKVRFNATVRPPLEPSPLFKLGHVVLQRPDFARSSQWYMRHFGVIPSDVQFLSNGRPALAFFRLDRGRKPADHHSFALLGGLQTSLMHVSFETFDLDSVGQGNQYLRARGWTHFWGIGRHVLGSQVFDYWKDPAGDEWEHYADGDVMDAEFPTAYSPLTRGSLWTWGDDLPDSMRPDIAPEDIDKIHAAGGFGNLELAQVKVLLEALRIQPRPWMR